MSDSNLQIALSYLDAAGESEYIGESVSQLEHALQCAYFAEQSGHSQEVILASLFHDIGHYAHQTEQPQMAELGVIYHEWIGAWLAYQLGFSAKVALLIGHHVDAKRYLAAKKPNYHERLSKASQGTLLYQGGMMTEDEMLAFEQHVIFKEILQVRVNDERAKIADLNVPDKQYYRQHISEHFKDNNTTTLDKSASITLKNHIDRNWVAGFKQMLLDEIK